MAHRLTDFARRHLSLIAYLIVVIAGIVGFSIVKSLYNDIQSERAARARDVDRVLIIADAVNMNQCKEIENLKAAIVLTIEEADRSIDSIDYYRLYPTEAAKAHERNRQAIEKFSPRSCDSIPKVSSIIGENSG